MDPVDGTAPVKSKEENRNHNITHIESEGIGVLRLITELQLWQWTHRPSSDKMKISLQYYNLLYKESNAYDLISIHNMTRWWNQGTIFLTCMIGFLPSAAAQIWSAIYLNTIKQITLTSVGLQFFLNNTFICDCLLTDKYLVFDRLCSKFFHFMGWLFKRLSHMFKIIRSIFLFYLWWLSWHQRNLLATEGVRCIC